MAFHIYWEIFLHMIFDQAVLPSHLYCTIASMTRGYGQRGGVSLVYENVGLFSILPIPRI